MLLLGGLGHASSLSVAAPLQCSEPPDQSVSALRSSGVGVYRSGWDLTGHGLPSDTRGSFKQLDILPRE